MELTGLLSRPSELSAVPSKGAAPDPFDHGLDGGKQPSRRVKGTEKFWSTAGGEAVLQPRGDVRER